MKDSSGVQLSTCHLVDAPVHQRVLPRFVEGRKGEVDAVGGGGHAPATVAAAVQVRVEPASTSTRACGGYVERALQGGTGWRDEMGIGHWRHGWGWDRDAPQNKLVGGGIVHCKGRKEGAVGLGGPLVQHEALVGPRLQVTQQ